MISVPGNHWHLNLCATFQSKLPTIAFNSTIDFDMTATIVSSDSLLGDYSTYKSTTTHPLPFHFCDQLNQALSHPVFNDHVQEYMHWHCHLNHASFPVMHHMAKSKLLPQHISSILHKMHRFKQKPPLYNDCVCAKMCTKPWRQKPTIQPTYHSSLTLKPGHVVSVDQLISSTPGLVACLHGGWPTN
jgi:hypothetical protein